MATLLLTAVGTLIGGPIGGALGALAGQQLDLAVIGAKARQGPRLKELALQTSSYGAPIARCYGRMRIAGSVIWATELKESRDKSGGGKGKPKVVTYSYSASFAVALTSRPIVGIGRIWADGNLLRGAAGDLKAGGTLRVHLGHGDQPPDPMLAAAEGADSCPAFRNLAYVVFEDLALADFGNRIPSLTVEVFGDAGAVTLAAILADVIPEANVVGLEQAIEGYAIETGSSAQVIEGLAEIVPLTCVSADAGLVVQGASPGPAGLLPAPLASNGDASAPPLPALTFHREPLPQRRDTALRYYDVDRDYQPGMQRAGGRSHGGEPTTIEFPAALGAAGAAALADGIAARRERARESATCRIATAARTFAPGRIVAVPGAAGRWLVESWELDRDGIELGLRRIGAAETLSASGGDSGRSNFPPDVLAGPTILAAFELPWDGLGSPGEARLHAAVSSASAGWGGAALFVERASSGLEPLGGSGRRRATVGVVNQVLAPGPATVLDWANPLEVTLAAPDMGLAAVLAAQLAAGANRALVGAELIQFARAEALGASRWLLRGLLRGRGGTEWAICGHAAGERFVLIDDALVAIDPAAVGDPAHARIAALGLGDSEPVLATIGLPGTSREPLMPVRGKLALASDGSLSLHWVRRARGAWLWRDGLEVPLVEQSESYLVTVGAADAPVAQWLTSVPSLNLDPTTLAGLRATAPGALLSVRQRGDHGLSRALLLGALP